MHCFVLAALILELGADLSQGIRVLESTVKLGEEDIISGASIKEPLTPVETEDLTVCLRFNLKSLSGADGRVDLMTISDFISDPRVLCTSTMVH